MNLATYRSPDQGIHLDTYEISTQSVSDTAFTVPRNCKVLIVNAIHGPVSVTIPNDREITVVKGDSSTNAVLVKATGLNIIGFTSQSLTNQYSSATTIWTPNGLMLAANFTTANVRKMFGWLGTEQFSGTNSPKIVTVGRFAENSMKPGRIISLRVAGTFDTTLATVAPMTVELHLDGTVTGGNITGSKIIASGNMPALSTNVSNRPFFVKDLDLYILDGGTMLQSFGSMDISDNALLTKQLDLSVITPVAFDPTIAHDVRVRVNFGTGVNGTVVTMRSFAAIIY